MSRPFSFFFPGIGSAPPYILKGPEADHLSRVLRIKAGRSVRLFDGKGLEGLFTVAGISRGEVSLVPIEGTVKRISPPVCRLILAPAWNKNARRDFFFEKAAELGVYGIHFWKGERSQGEMPSVPKEAWQGRLIGGAKQSERGFIPEIFLRHGGLQDLIRQISFDRAFFLWEKEKSTDLISGADFAVPGVTLAILGSEGGLSSSEVDFLRTSGIKSVSLGDTVLRWETAAFLCMGLASLLGEGFGA